MKKVHQPSFSSSSPSIGKVGRTLLLAGITLFCLMLTACFPTQAAPSAQYQITIDVDNKSIDVQVSAGSTVQGALDQAGIQINPLDRIDPAGFTVLTDGALIRVIRVREVFDVKETILPFEQQTVRNESLPEGKKLLIQSGVNGLQQVTYRQVFENEQEVSRSVFKTVMVTEPRPEIIVVGVQKPFTPVAVPGRLAYLADGNAWVMEDNTGNRRPLVTSGDLDGRVFKLNEDGSWLLFTRKSNLPAGEEINTLWMLNISDEGAKPIDLRINNIIHYAEWVPTRGLTVSYSTVEPRATAPGWQANNDLQLATYSSSGMIVKTEQVIEANSGGIYGWWGTHYAWSPDGVELAYARPDSVGLVDVQKNALNPLVSITPYQTRADWAWVTGLGWAPSHKVLVYSSHPPKTGLDAAEASPYFDLTALVIADGSSFTLAPQSGMFAYPISSPKRPDGGYWIAFLQSVFPEQSETGRYRLTIMDRDGSNLHSIFPPEGLSGLDPQQVTWSPQPFKDGSFWLAVTFQNNLWLVNAADGQTQQITGDGLIKKIDWK